MRGRDIGDWTMALICLTALIYYAVVAWALGLMRRR